MKTPKAINATPNNNSSSNKIPPPSNPYGPLPALAVPNDGRSVISISYPKGEWTGEKRRGESSKETSFPLFFFIEHPLLGFPFFFKKKIKFKIIPHPGSSNPGSSPVGGSQFYALTSSLNLSTATRVTLNYSVLFPLTYDFVKGGKLPGLYGGSEGCSGGNSASDCWSSRMMWRGQGLGELYLYLPQASQDPSLCLVPPYSECNSEYGISVGRGSFRFRRGAWNHISQTIQLNSSPTSKDGGFIIRFEGQQVVRFENKVFYPASFKGIFFSTFYGGHGQDWSPSSDQKSYFRDFSVSIDS
ncbi:hypothetical protein IE53DRAFT_315976 [Violaceomyces palustris]|uniref:Uncharacterized protein n=1 Tax=Violaceomyces palustris TaxID=1673888 RepID=A0ACD0NX36_9BASI|nr:hypothetical protein IE53DRAFT_315976 [Violaceomyces palustris]